MIAKVCQVRQVSGYFCEVSDCHWSIDSEHIGFEEDSFLLEPGKKVAVWASKFDVAKATVGEHMTADAYLRLVLTLDVCSQNFKVFFEFVFSFGHRCQSEDNLVVVARCSQD